MRARLLLLLLGSCAGAFAQSLRGYVFLAPGVWNAPSGASHYQGGLGAELIAGRGIGAGFEAGALGNSFDALATASVNGIYQFRFRKASDLFVTAGYSIASPEAGISVHGVNAGGGMNYWFHRRLALRLELRYHVLQLSSRPVHALGARIGLGFGGRGN